MKNQKICIIGGGLTGLITAITLSKLNCKIDLMARDIEQNSKSNRTIAISQNNLDFLDKLNISKLFKKNTWPCSLMKLYTETENKNFLEVFELNKENEEEKVLYMLENSKIMKLMMNKIKKIKSISMKNYKKVSLISHSGSLKNVKYNNNISKYNLVIICSGYNSCLTKNAFDSKIIENSYKETGITTILEHSEIKNNIARQIFLENSIFAMLPISNNKTSIVWSVKKNISRSKNSFLKNKIKFYTKNYLKKIKFLSNIELKDLNLLIRKKYYSGRVLLFGDALHVMHPFIGQGFNMTLRDLASLEKILTKKINLGLDIGSSDILSEFSSETKPRNFAFSVASDLLKNSLYFKKPRNDLLKMLNKSNLVKDIFFNIADKGFKF